MHNHDTNETFIPMTGTWRASWEDKDGKSNLSILDRSMLCRFRPA